MDSDWNSLVASGWEKVEHIVNDKKIKYYKTPPVNGIQRKIYQSRDLKKGEKHLISILFPNYKKVSVTQRSCDEILTPTNDKPREHYKYKLVFKNKEMY